MNKNTIANPEASAAVVPSAAGRKCLAASSASLYFASAPLSSPSSSNLRAV